MWYILPKNKHHTKKKKKAAETLITDVNECISLSAVICHSDMLLLLLVLCSVLQFVRDVKPTLACFNTLSLTNGLRQVCFFSLTFVCYSGFLDSISLIFSAHWGNPDNQWGSSELGETNSVYLSVCNDVRWKDWLLPPSVPTFNVWREERKTKRDKSREKVEERPHGLDFIFCLSVLCVHVQLHN